MRGGGHWTTWPWQHSLCETRPSPLTPTSGTLVWGCFSYPLLYVSSPLAPCIVLFTHLIFKKIFLQWESETNLNYLFSKYFVVSFVVFGEREWITFSDTFPSKLLPISYLMEYPEENQSPSSFLPHSFPFLFIDWTHTPCVGRRSLNYWTAREVPPIFLLKRPIPLLGLMSSFFPSTSNLRCS